MKPLEAVNWLFPLWQKKNKGRQHIRRKNSRSNASLILRQFFRHIIDNGFNMLSPLDNLTFTPLRFGRLAAALKVMIDSPLTTIADCQPSDAKAAFMRRYNKFPLARRPKGGIALVGSCTATILKNEKGKRFIKKFWKW